MLPAKRTLGPNAFSREFHGALKEKKIMAVLHDLLKRIGKGETFLNVFSESDKPLIPDKDITRKKNCRPIRLMNIDVIFPSEILTNQIQRYTREIINHD